MDARFSRPMEAWSRCSPAEQVTTDSYVISSQWVDKILFYSILVPVGYLGTVSNLVLGT